MTAGPYRRTTGRRPARRARTSVRQGSVGRWVEASKAQEAAGYYRANGRVHKDFEAAKADIEGTVQMKRGWHVDWHPEATEPNGDKRWMGLVLNSKGVLQRTISVNWHAPAKPKPEPKPKKYWGIFQEVPSFRMESKTLIATFDTKELAQEGMAARKALGVRRLELVPTNRKVKLHVTADSVPASHNVVPIRKATDRLEDMTPGLEAMSTVLAQGAQGKNSRTKK